MHVYQHLGKFIISSSGVHYLQYTPTLVHINTQPTQAALCRAANLYFSKTYQRKNSKERILPFKPWKYIEGSSRFRLTRTDASWRNKQKQIKEEGTIFIKPELVKVVHRETDARHNNTLWHDPSCCALNTPLKHISTCLPPINPADDSFHSMKASDPSD